MITKIMNCKICKSSANYTHSEKLLKKYAANYYRCTLCGYLFIDNPIWLEEAYSSAIAAADTGLVYRNIRNCEFLTIYLFLNKYYKYKQVDLSGGTGLLTRLMRDNGYDFYWSDPYCENVHAKGFEYSENILINCATAYEVLEHLEDPLQYIQKIFENQTIQELIISTELYGKVVPKRKDWAYYACETGQHIGFFQTNTLKYIANKLNLYLISNNNIHIFSKKPVNKFIFFLSQSKPVSLVCIIVRKILKSKIIPDYNKILLN